MTFTVGVSVAWRREWPNYLKAQKANVAAFLAIYSGYGLSNQTLYPGRLGNSWHGLPPNDPQHIHAQSNSLWHYHIGYPYYQGGQSGPPRWGQTSADVLHFQWIGDHIKLIEIAPHQVGGRFYVPAAQALADPTAPAPPPHASPPQPADVPDA